MQADNGKAEYKKYPKLLKERIKAQSRFIESHPNSKTKQYFGNSYNATFFQLFCTNLEEYREKMSPDLWGRQLDTRQFLSEYFDIEL